MKRRLWMGVLALGGSLAVASLLFAYSRVALAPPAVVLPPRPAEASREQVQHFCGHCHAWPSPESFPRDAWRLQVKQGYDFYRESLLHLDVPPLESVVAFYEKHAPEQLPPADRPVELDSRWLQWEPRGVSLPDQEPWPEVTHVTLAPLFQRGKLDVLVCDARLNQVLAYSPYADPPVWRVLGRAKAPCHVEVVDLDGDQVQDLIVANLGSFLPSNEKVGSVEWWQGRPDGTFQTHTLLDGVGRVADARAGDFDGDGRLDLMAAVFGWRGPGAVVFLRNQTPPGGPPRFEPQVLDDRHGASQVSVGDVNRDGRLDAMVLISQEHETVLALVNQGGGRFQKEVVWAAPHPAFSCSGAELTDLDGDGDLDVLLSHGDVLDWPVLLKPYHGVTWLENTGTFPFRARLLTSMYGVMRAAAADLDGDGDLDVVAVSHLPEIDVPDRDKQRLDAVVMLEQQVPGEFVRRSLAQGACDHFSCAVGDWDGDGRPDVVAGNFTPTWKTPIKDWIRLWNNRGPWR